MITLLPHQAGDRDRARSIAGPIINFSQTGTGKTQSAIAIAQDAGEPVRILYVINGALQQHKAVGELRDAGLPATLLLDAKKYEPVKGAHAWVVSYESIKFSMRPIIGELLDSATAVIFDEAHALGGHQSARTKLWKQAMKRFRGRVQAMTATPVKTSPMNLVAMLDAIGLAALARQVRKHTRWETIRIGRREFPRCTGWDDVQAARNLVAPRRIYHSKQEVIKDLPPVRFESIRLPVSEQKYRKLVAARLLDGQGGTNESARQQALESYFRSGDIEPTGAGLHLIGECLRAASILKAPACAEFAASCAESEKLIVFFLNYAPLDAFCAELDRLEVGYAAVRKGSTGKARVAAVEQFKADSQILVGTFGTISEGISLHEHCSHILVAELPWEVHKLEQAAGRIHRIGRNDATLLTSAIAVGTGKGQLLDIEFRLAANHRRKIENAEGLGLSMGAAAAAG